MFMSRDPRPRPNFGRAIGSGLLVAVLMVVNDVQARSPGLGQPVTATELAAIDFTVMPDGAGLPVGSGTAEQGVAIYQRHCLACHGDKGVDGVNDRLSGGHDSLSTLAPVKTVGSYWPYATTVFDFIRRAMPYTAPGSLGNDDIYALTAYLLYINDVVGEQDVMDARSLPEVNMPNRDNFVWAAGVD